MSVLVLNVGVKTKTVLTSWLWVLKYKLCVIKTVVNQTLTLKKNIHFFKVKFVLKILHFTTIVFNAHWLLAYYNADIIWSFGVLRMLSNYRLIVCHNNKTSALHAQHNKSNKNFTSLVSVFLHKCIIRILKDLWNTSPLVNTIVVLIQIYYVLTGLLRSHNIFYDIICILHWRCFDIMRNKEWIVNIITLFSTGAHRIRLHGSQWDMTELPGSAISRRAISILFYKPLLGFVLYLFFHMNV